MNRGGERETTANMIFVFIFAPTAKEKTSQLSTYYQKRKKYGEIDCTCHKCTQNLKIYIDHPVRSDPAAMSPRR